MDTLKTPRDENPGGFYLRHALSAFLTRPN